MSDDTKRVLARLKQAQAAAAETATPKEPCPPPEQLFDLREGLLPPEVSAAVAEHIAGCESCAEALRLAVAMVPSLALAADPTVREGAGRGRGWLFGGAALIAAGVATLLLGRPETAAPPSSSVESRDVYRGPGGLTVRRDSPRMAPRAAFRLVWSAGPPGTVYAVRVHDAELRLVYEAFELGDPQVVVPPSALAGYGDGSPMLWSVVASLPDGARVALPTWTTRVGVRGDTGD